jgi:hypothetical protein
MAAAISGCLKMRSDGEKSPLEEYAGMVLLLFRAAVL